MRTVSQKTEVILELSRVLNASPVEIFDVWTRYEHLMHWWKAKPFYQPHDAVVNCRVGGKYRLEMYDPHEEISYVVAGEFLEVVEGEKLVYTWRWEWPRGGAKDAKLTVEFRPLEGRTELILRHELPSTKSAETHYKGWSGCLDHLEAYLGECGEDGDERL